jgi:hypothetical protein
VLIVNALLGSFWVKMVGLAFVGLVAVWGYGAVKQWQGEVIGGAQVTAVVTRKADANAAVAVEIREAVAAGQKTSKNPYVRDVR